MIEKVGIIGVGHLATYLVEGIKRAKPELEVVLSEYLGDFTKQLVEQYGATPVPTNQDVANAVDLVIVSTRPQDIVSACKSVSFRPGTTVVSTAAGITLDLLQPVSSPASTVRAMPITCAALNLSPTLLYPENNAARELFELLGTVHVLSEEGQFTPASVISAYYGWVYALLDETVKWTTDAGVPAKIAKDLVLETTRGACAMGLDRSNSELSELLESLATPGGITRLGLKTLHDRKSLDAWIEASDVVLAHMQKDD